MKKPLIGLTIGLGLVLTGCGPVPPSPADNYSGKAVVDESHSSGTKQGCEVWFTLANGQKDKERLGRRASCDGWTAGRQITLTNGRINR